MGQKEDTCNDKTRIDKVGITSGKLTSWTGLTFLVHYLKAIDIYQLLERYFSGVRGSTKGIPVKEAFKQLICFFVDGTNLGLTYFVDAVFRGGSRHSNYGNTVVTMVEHVVEKVRCEYDEKVPIVLTADTYRRSVSSMVENGSTQQLWLSILGNLTTKLVIFRPKSHLVATGLEKPDLRNLYLTSL